MDLTVPCLPHAAGPCHHAAHQNGLTLDSHPLEAICQGELLSAEPSEVLVCTRARAHVHTCAYTWVCTCACVFYSLRKPEGTNSDPILRSLETDSRKLLCRKVGTIFLFLTRQLYKCVRVGCILHHSN